MKRLERGDEKQFLGGQLFEHHEFYGIQRRAHKHNQSTTKYVNYF
jgi:hypothetical protein